MEPLSIGLGIVGAAAAIAAARRWTRRMTGAGLPSTRPEDLAKLLREQPWTPVPEAFAPFRGARPELRGRPSNTIIAAEGLAARPPVFRAALLALAEDVGIPVDSLALVMAHESKFNPQSYLETRRGVPVKRGEGDFVAGGLGGFTAGANLPGFTTLEQMRSIVKLSDLEQLALVGVMYRRNRAAQGSDPGTLLMWNFISAIARVPGNTVLGRRDSKDPLPGTKYTLGTIYKANPVFDPGGRRGYFTRDDVVASIRHKAREAAGKRITIDGTIFDYAPAAPAKGGSSPASTSSTPPAPAPAPTPSNALAPAPSGGAGPAPAAPEAVRPVGELAELPERASAGGLLLRAAKAGALMPIEWSSIRVGPYVIRVSSDALRALDGVRYPVSMDEAMTIARHLGVILPTREIFDAIWQSAPKKLVPRPLPPTAQMGSVGWSRRFSADIDAQKKALGLGPSDLVSVGKAWILHPRLVEKGAVNYGFFTPEGKPLQSVGGVHNAQHFDYSQVLQVVAPSAQNAETGASVDLRDVLAEETKGALSKWINALR